MRELHISKINIRDTRFALVKQAPVGEGQVRLKLDLFALTSNNVTYAAMGEGMLGYWDFFPASDGQGKVPVWGLGTVIESNAPDIAVGSRFYGYYPLAETLDVIPKKTPTGFIDTAPHRAPKAVLYNVYTDITADPAYDAAYEAEQTLFRPLYGTGWWAADFIKQGAAKTVVLSSASSKTALATAHQLKKLGGVQLIGLTSPGNESYVRESGLYDRVVLYADAASLKVEAPATYVDFLGRAEINAAVHRTLGDALTRSIIIGLTDWESARAGRSAAWSKARILLRPNLRRRTPQSRTTTRRRHDARSARLLSRLAHLRDTASPHRRRLNTKRLDATRQRRRPAKGWPSSVLLVAAAPRGRLRCQG